MVSGLAVLRASCGAGPTADIEAAAAVIAVVSPATMEAIVAIEAGQAVVSTSPTHYVGAEIAV